MMNIVEGQGTGYKISTYIRVYKKPQAYFVYNSKSGLKAKIHDSLLISQVELLTSGEILYDADERLIQSGVCVPEFINEQVAVLNNFQRVVTANDEILRLIILPTRNCNFECVYCYESQTPEVMSDETILSLISATKNHIENKKELKSLQLEWFGGEPLLQYDTILKISSELYDFCTEKGIYFWMSMTTNGYLLTKDKAEQLLKYNCTNYQITVDGEKEHHDKLRPRKSGAPTWDVIYSNLLTLRDVDAPNLKITLRVNFHMEMLLDIKKYLERVKKDFNDDPRFSVYMIKINPPEGKDLDFEAITNIGELAVQEHIFDIYKSMGISIENYMSNVSPLSSMCYARYNSTIIVDVDGTLRKCTEYLDDNIYNKIGILSDGIFDIDEDVHAQWLMPNNSFLSERGCYECIDMPVCFGGPCPIQWFRGKTISCNAFQPLTDKMIEMYFTEKSEAF